MRRLREPETGCEWDRAQSFETIAPYTIEEAYEVADAIARGDMADLKDELGDLQLQVVYHARMAEEIGAFAIDDVIAAICAKMIRRHPHIFGDEQTSPGWETLKAAERHGHEDKSALAGVAVALPALKRAEKLQRRAARVGFDWPDISGPRAKILEELGELDAATSDEEREAELGDLLFSVVNYARHLGYRSGNRLAGGGAAIREALPQGGRDSRQIFERYEYRRAGGALARRSGKPNRLMSYRHPGEAGSAG